MAAAGQLATVRRCVSRPEVLMIDRRRFVGFACAFAALNAVALPPLSARAEPAFQRLLPLLVELPGWTAAKADGMAMEAGGSRMVMAQRGYERGEAQLSAQIMIGPAAQGALAAANAGMKIETSESRMSSAVIDGLQVTRTFQISDKSGAIVVALGDAAMFMLTFNGIDEDEALRLSKTFNWQAIRAAVGK
jgi:hypothetical protein